MASRLKTQPVLARVSPRLKPGNTKGGSTTLPLSSCLTGLESAVWQLKSYWGGRLSAVDLLVLTSLDQLIFILKILFSFLTKQATLMRRSTVLILPTQLVFPAQRFGFNPLALNFLSTPNNFLHFSLTSNQYFTAIPKTSDLKGGVGLYSGFNGYEPIWAFGPQQQIVVMLLNDWPWGQ